MGRGGPGQRGDLPVQGPFQGGRPVLCQCLPAGGGGPDGEGCKRREGPFLAGDGPGQRCSQEQRRGHRHPVPDLPGNGQCGGSGEVCGRRGGDDPRGRERAAAGRNGAAGRKNPDRL